MSTPNEANEGQYRQVLHNLIMGALGSEINTKIVRKDKRDIMKHMGAWLMLVQRGVRLIVNYLF